LKLQPQSLSVQLSFEGERTVMRLIGELDMSTAPEVIARFEELQERRLLLDLSALTFMDSTGLGALLKIAAESDAVEVIHGPRQVQRVFELTGTVDRFEWASRAVRPPEDGTASPRVPAALRL
jgi:anti-anti-sigma factor